MTNMAKVSSIFVFIIIAASCATAPIGLPEKYNLDYFLEPVDQVSTFKSKSWDQVDKQSIILKVNWDDYYLLILRRPIETRIPSLTIGISGTGSTIAAGHDMVVVDDSEVKKYYGIEKIYKLKGKEQVEEIKSQLREK